MTARFAVMGDPIAHSLSPLIHHYFAKQFDIALSYEKILMDVPHFEEQVSTFFQQGGVGLNITSPGKPRAFSMSEVHSLRCHEARAANTLWISEGQLHADNTDGAGLLRDLRHHIDIAGMHILILGAGGAARGIIGPLLAMHPAQLTIANRSVEKAHDLQLDFTTVHTCSFEALARHVDTHYHLIINATSAHFSGDTIDVPGTLMATKPFCYDLAYQQEKDTSFVAWAKTFGCTALDGLGMLVEQAAEAFFIWHGVMPDTAAVMQKLRG